MDKERLLEIHDNLAVDWCTYEGDLPLYDAAVELLAEVDHLTQAAKLVLDEFADWYDGPGYFPSSFVAAIIRLRRALENGK